MRSRPIPIRLAQAALFLFMGSAFIQAIVFVRYSLWALSWMLPASLALIAGSVLAAIQQRRAFARPLAMAGFGAFAIRGSIALTGRGFPDLAYSLPEILGIALVVGALGLATWFGLSTAAGRDLARI